MQGIGGRRCQTYWGLLGLLLLVSPAALANPYFKQMEQREVELRRRLRTPAGILPLAGLLELWELVPPSRITRLLQVATGARVHPLVRGYGQHLRAEVARHQGRSAEAARLLTAAGFVPSWQYCGPLPRVGTGRSCNEMEPRPGQVRGAGPRWSTLQRPGHHAGVDLGHLLGAGPAAPPRQKDTAAGKILLLKTSVSSTRGQPAALRLSAGTAWEVMVNGVLIKLPARPRLVTGRRWPAARVDQAAVGVRLRRGENELQLKVTLRKGLRLYARLTRPDGAPLRGITYTVGGAGPRVLARSRGVRDPVTLGGWLCGQWPGGQSDPRALRDVARYLKRVSPGDPCFPSLEMVVRRWIKAAPSVEVFLLSAELLVDHNQEREALEQALLVSPGDPWALYRMATYHHENRQLHLALARLGEFLRQAPGFFPAALKLAEIHRTAGLNELAARILDTQLRQHPRVGRVLLARADHALGQDDLALARSLYERHLINNQDELYSRNTLASLALRRGEPAEALTHLRAAIKHNPRRLFLRKKAAQVLAGMGRSTEAVAECEAALSVDPHAAPVLEELGRLHHRAGRHREAWRSWRRALAVRPQNPELRSYLAHLNPRLSRGQAELHREDPARVIAGASKSRRGRDPAVVLLDLTATEVLPNGLSRTLRQRIVRVDREAGAERLSEYAIQYNPDRQAVTINAAKIHRAAGGVSLAGEEEISLNEPWARMWYDLRARRLRFVGLRPGDLIEIEYLLEDVAPDNQFATYFGDLRHLAEDLPVRRFRYVLITPAARRFNIHQPRGRVRYEVEERGTRRIHRWTARDLAKIVEEPAMPGWSEVSDTIHVSTYERWAQVTRWYWELVKHQRGEGPALAQTARRITRGLTTEIQKIRAIHGFVTRELRYVGLEFGIHGYKPYAATQVLNRKFGDCKDKSTLLISMLAQIGVDATLVLVRTRRQGRMAATPASLAPFDHAVVYIPGHRLYLDATAEFSGSGELPAQVQGVMALHINEGRGELRSTPETGARANRVIQRDRYQLSPRGAGRLRREVEIRGTEAASWRRRYQVEEGRLQRYEKALNRSLGGVKVLKLEMRGLDQLEQPVEVRVEAQVQGVTRSAAPRRFTVPCAGHPSSLTRRWARLSQRRYALVLPHARSAARIIELRAPPGWRAEQLPTPRAINTPLGTFKRQLERKTWGVRVTLELELLRSRIAPADYGAFREFLLQVDQLQSEEVTFAR